MLPGPCMPMVVDSRYEYSTMSSTGLLWRGESETEREGAGEGGDNSVLWVCRARVRT